MCIRSPLDYLKPKKVSPRIRGPQTPGLRKAPSWYGVLERWEVLWLRVVVRHENINHSQVKERPLFTVTYLFVYVRGWEQRIGIGHLYVSEAE